MKYFQIVAILQAPKKEEVIQLLTTDDLKKLLVAEGKEISGITLDKTKAGDILRVRNIMGKVFLFETTVPISRRAKVYRFDGKNFSFKGDFHISEPLENDGIVLLDEYDTGIITSIFLIRHS